MREARSEDTLVALRDSSDLLWLLESFGDYAVLRNPQLMKKVVAVDVFRKTVCLMIEIHAEIAAVMSKEEGPVREVVRGLRGALTRLRRFALMGFSRAVFPATSYAQGQNPADPANLLAVAHASARLWTFEMMEQCIEE